MTSALMDLIKAIFLLFLLLASSMAAATFSIAAVETDHEDGGAKGLAAADETGNEPEISFENADDQSSATLLLRRLLSRRSYRSGRYSAMTCDRYPKVCHLKGSPGHTCCRKRCVSLRTDNLNCGRCGKKCRYGEICCRGKCVNALYDRYNCGGCQNKCGKGSHCRYGMCSYAH